MGVKMRESRGDITGEGSLRYHGERGEKGSGV
jgi:hypothetical protein